MRMMLMLSDREEIFRGLAEGLLYTEIGLRIGRDRSVISREVVRHGGRERYRAATAGRSRVTVPHIHIPLDLKRHWPTGRMTLENAIAWCIESGLIPTGRSN